MKIATMDSGNFALARVVQSLAQNRIQLVPQIVAGSAASQCGTLVDVLLANLIRDDRKPAGGLPTMPPDQEN
jgi:hypothetical protein